MRISDWSSDVCSSDLMMEIGIRHAPLHVERSGERRVHDDNRRRNIVRQPIINAGRVMGGGNGVGKQPPQYRHARLGDLVERQPRLTCILRASARGHRSEEHTSELQSLMRISYAVFCLKKKNTK